MSEYKEFKGKTLDEAIAAACTFFEEPREKLEVDILSDAKGGIFGLVGARKASIRARRVHLESILDIDEPSSSAPAEKNGRAHKAKPPRNGRQADLEQARAPAAQACPPSRGGSAPPAKKPAGNKPSADEGRTEIDDKRARVQGQNTAPDNDDPRDQPAPQSAFAGDDSPEEFSRTPLSAIDPNLVLETTGAVVTTLVAPLLGEAPLTVRLAGESIHVAVDAGDDPGLLIGREGQTLAAIQYLAARMIAGRLQCLVRIHIDAGDYRQRQDERLRETALALAEKVRENGRPQLTRPLSSYQRRVIHVALQDDPLVHTHSKGDGDLKRVVIALRRGNGQGRQTG